MVSFIFAVVFLVISLSAVVMRKAYALVTPREMKRQAAGGNELATQLYRAVGHGESLAALLWLLILLPMAVGFVLLSQSAPVWVSVLSIAVVVWLAFSWLPHTRLTGFGMRTTVYVTPAVDWVLQHVGTLLLRVIVPLKRRFTPQHSGLYELTDLLDLLELQSTQADSRITSEEIELVRHVLQFGDQYVRDALRPRKQVKAVSLEDTVGPILLDELHASGQSSFPVKKTPRSKDIVACLYLGDVGIHSKGSVEDYAVSNVVYVNESDTLADALHVFFQTKHQLAVVVDNFEEYVGVLTLEDILHTLVGKPAPNETLGSHQDKSAVAARHTALNEQADSESVAESDATVVK